MRAKELAKFITYSCLGSFAFLCLARIATATSCCGNDHPWSLHEPASGKMPYLWCTHPLGEPRATRSKGGRVRLRRAICSEKCTWSDDCPWAQKMNKLKPDQTVELMYQWSQLHSVEEAAHETGINPNTVGDFYHVCRETTTEFLEKATRNEKIGGAGRIVCIDETHVTKKKRNRGGFQGRSTLGHETILMAGAALDGPWAGRNSGVAKVSRRTNFQKHP